MLGEVDTTEEEKGRNDEDVFWEPAESATAEVKIERSLFVGQGDLCRNEAEARAFLERVRTLHRNATHNSWAYSLSYPETEYCSDDGEPAGTAGKPILRAVRQSGMVNLMVVVTRYFGGIKLGVRGLIEAYGQTAGSVVAKTKRVLRMRSRRLVICLPYGIMGDVIRLLEIYGTPDPPMWRYGDQAEVFAEIKMSAAPQVTVVLHELQARKLIFSWSWFLS
jgi:uncharacterized YigZ family protein